MKWTIVSALTLIAVQLWAFDSDAWLGKREVFAREAERLQATYSNCVIRLDAPAENVTLPVETFSDGSVKTIIFAKKAQYFLKEGLVWAEGVKVSKFNEDKSVDIVIEAEHCLVDKNTKSGWAEGPAKVTQGKSVFKGTGIYFSSTDGYVKVFDDSDIDSKDLKFNADTAGLSERLKTSEGPKSAHITSRRCDIDRDAGVIMFEDKVKAVYSDEYVMCSDRIFMFTTGTNELSRVVAVGDVSITNDTKVGTCEMAVYRRKKGVIEMFSGGSNSVARLVDTGKNASVLEGSRIKFWIASEQVEVDRSQITVETKNADKKDFL